jgi:hypothetical protein
LLLELELSRRAFLALALTLETVVVPNVMQELGGLTFPLTFALEVTTALDAVFPLPLPLRRL